MKVILQKVICDIDEQSDQRKFLGAYTEEYGIIVVINDS